MSVRLRIALGFALVAVATAAAVSLATPQIVGRGFARLEADAASAAPGAPTGQGQGHGSGHGPGPQAGIHAAQVEQDTTITLIAVALGAAAVASVAGFVIAGRMARPLTRLADASRALAAGDLARRSNLADRTDEFGDVGRSFDRMAARLQQSDEERRRFVADAVHELRTPLTVIDGTAAAIEEGVFAPEPRHLRTIREQTAALSRIVEDLRTISQAEAGQLALSPRPVDVAETLGSVAAAFEARAAAQQVTISVDAAAGCIARADLDRLGQIVRALADNALRHTPPGGAVRLHAAGGHGVVRVAVEDSGPGIAPEDLPLVFERFYQADRSRDRRTGSSGLGLAIVRALAQAHGGAAGAENVAGGGARVWVELPASDEGRAAGRH